MGCSDWEVLSLLFNSLSFNHFYVQFKTHHQLGFATVMLQDKHSQSERLTAHFMLSVTGSAARRLGWAGELCFTLVFAGLVLGFALVQICP